MSVSVEVAQRERLVPGSAKPVLACLLAAGALFSGLAIADGTPRGDFAVWAIGLPNGYVVMDRQAPSIHVTEDDAAQGVVHVFEGSRLAVTTGSQRDFAVHFATRTALFRTVQIEGIGRTVELGARGGTVVERDLPAGRHVVAVNYRFELAPGTAPGTYSWPLEMATRGAAEAEFAASGASPHLRIR